ncbi:MAG: DUF1640 domain-containing protein [Methylococcaceae bacterium]|jgi:hypothetical protein
MSTITFDTLHFANKLKAVGFTDEQAQVITELQRTATDNTLEQARHDYHLDDVATKRDLKEMDTALRHEIELLRSETKRDIAETKAELIRWVVGVGLLQTSLIIGALMKMAHLI